MKKCTCKRLEENGIGFDRGEYSPEDLGAGRSPCPSCGAVEVFGRNARVSLSNEEVYHGSIWKVWEDRYPESGRE